VNSVYPAAAPLKSALSEAGSTGDAICLAKIDRFLKQVTGHIIDELSI
jgi:hypothetical protein